ncbi:hypothetical protein BJV85_002048 [Clostridium acetobutylicum]|uniref:Uncharacterized protein n=1 Tax=Clostridium acetobutylicum (strain ATCC 824 / DSM 792 / JCM 1419 / IAM 19013 / LMG 5710 / NBRC 13948 / NRRL B-527 / VKM B-1787 / 2291 / W) TaxID=272562 RepID=Q97HR6_CLOAB|nr:MULTISPECIES: hypothetical protein [Clostridium]AAK79904.1 Hypothetical protein CA_C1942 [Clostridium acetobutylicum ATCC 824]ADZ20995.1 Conserved hypothetical protein [Clostridium acetobutylicum EA 2018]AEI32080.1 hypothetical protein SMB_G1972 [Clostridium acetobutylicum DSM 1731]AWV79663.1 hypothetical protein DK921_06030 [Clostridium acetobutylicum]MBC2394361.1 hypothetical protein [Clostridium acetobutylicum]
MEVYIDIDNNNLIVDRPGFVYSIGTPKRNARAIQALKLDCEKELITESEYLEAMDKLQKNLI